MNAVRSRSSASGNSSRMPMTVNHSPPIVIIGPSSTRVDGEPFGGDRPEHDGRRRRRWRRRATALPTIEPRRVATRSMSAASSREALRLVVAHDVVAQRTPRRASTTSATTSTGPIRPSLAAASSGRAPSPPPKPVGRFDGEQVGAERFDLVGSGRPGSTRRGRARRPSRRSRS